jgi:6-phosphofructokinase 1
MMQARHGVVVQCGGPTAVVNASLAAIITAWQHHSTARLFGARWGFRGLRTGDWIDLTNFRDPERLRLQAGAALGSARDPLDDDAIAALLLQFASVGVSVLFVIGGNGSLTAAHRVARAAALTGGGLRVIGVPKTIDNDIRETDVTPGFGSAAQFVARAVHDAALDLHSMRGFDDVTVIEVMGRHTGWLAAAASLVRSDDEALRPLILVPERTVDEDAFLAGVRERHRTGGVCLVVTAEGVRDRAGRFLVEEGRRIERDGSGQQLLGLAGGPTPYLAHLINHRLGLRCRQCRPDVIQRSSVALVSALDRELAVSVGHDAVRFASEGSGDVMIALRRDRGAWRTEAVPLERVAGGERLLPDHYLTGEFDVAPSFAGDMRCFLDDWRPGATLFTHNNLIR